MITGPEERDQSLSLKNALLDLSCLNADIV